jgi:outer membrane protein assembly factor BamB
MYDAFTGNWICTMAPAMTGQVVMGEKGDLLVYILNGARNWFTLWNSSKVTGMLRGDTGTNALQWRPPVGVTLNWTTGIEWNVTVPDVPGNQVLTKVGDVVLAASSAGPTTLCIIGYSMQDGHQLYAFNMTSNNAAQEQGLFTYYFAPPVGGSFAWFKQETREWFGFDSYTGQQLWGPTVPYENPWGMFSSTSSGNGAMSPNIANGKLYTDAYDGMLHCIDAKTGQRLWDYYAGNSGLETPYGSYPLTSGMFAIADGKVYVATGEHSPNQPMWRGSKLHVVDAETGQGIWNVLGWYETPAIADGYLVAFNNYDSQIYCFGKGLSATTVSAPNTAIPEKTAVLLTGTVTDQSPGNTCLGIPAAGTPAIADESQSQWMEYLYMQKAKPTNATGVQVHLTAIDPNGNFQDIGTAISDADGLYAIEWTPPVPGVYKVTAEFTGSKSYFASSGTTRFLVRNAPSAEVTQTPPITTSPAIPTQTPTTTSPSVSPTQAPPPSSGDLTTIYIATTAVVVILVVAVAASILRRRK